MYVMDKWMDVKNATHVCKTKATMASLMSTYDLLYSKYDYTLTHY